FIVSREHASTGLGSADSRETMNRLTIRLDRFLSVVSRRNNENPAEHLCPHYGRAKMTAFAGSFVMSIPVVCPRCTKKLWLAEKFAARPVTCPKCGESISVAKDQPVEPVSDDPADDENEAPATPTDWPSVLRTTGYVVHSISGLVFA